MQVRVTPQQLPVFCRYLSTESGYKQGTCIYPGRQLHRPPLIISLNSMRQAGYWGVPSDVVDITGKSQPAPATDMPLMACTRSHP